jgi:hypothetical protein
MLKYFILFALMSSLFAQISYPKASPRATVSQNFGVAKVTLDYGSPKVNNREIWGKLEPYGKVWRLGANEATTIELSHKLWINNQEIKAGKYAFFAIINEGEWTLILNSQADQWGAFSKKDDLDIIKFNVKTSDVSFTESLKFNLTAKSDSVLTVSFAWEKKGFSFDLKQDVKSLIQNDINRTLSWRNSYQAAQFAFNEKWNLNEAIKWIDSSIALAKNFQNLSLKAMILADLKNTKEAKKIGDEAFKILDSLKEKPSEKTINDFKKWLSELK